MSNPEPEDYEFEEEFEDDRLFLCPRCGSENTGQKTPGNYICTDCDYEWEGEPNDDAYEDEDTENEGD